MGETIARNMLSWLKLSIKLLLLHLVGCLYCCVNDARSHKHHTEILCHLLKKMQLTCAVWVESLNNGDDGRVDNMQILSEILSKIWVSVRAWPSFHLSLFVRCFVCNKPNFKLWPTPVAARSKAWVCGRLLAGIVGSNPAGGMDVSCECYVLLGRVLFDGPTPSPVDSYGVWCVWVRSWSLDNEEALVH